MLDDGWVEWRPCQAPLGKQWPGHVIRHQTIAYSFCYEVECMGLEFDFDQGVQADPFQLCACYPSRCLTMAESGSVTMAGA